MLRPSDRRLLLDALRPPAGYRLDRAIGTSYSLDLLALLTAPLAFTFFDWEDEEGRPTSDPLALLEAIRRHASRIHLFCQAGRVYVPRPGQTLLTYLEDSVFEVLPKREGGVFHPKIWLLRYLCDAKPIRYRLLCLSRNLTFDRSWDTALVLDGELTPRTRAFALNHPLGDFVAELPDLCLRPIPTEVKASIKILQEEVRRVRFEPPEGLEIERFHALGLGKRPYWPFPEGDRPLLIVSPFVSAPTIDRLAGERERVLLISRPEELTQLPKASREMLHEVLVLDPHADPDLEAAEEDGEGAEDGPELSGLHAKLLVFEDGWNVRIFTGSANATTAAMERNVELMVELRGKRSRYGIDAFLGEEESKGPATMRDLLRPFEAPDGPEKRDQIDREIGRRLDVGRLALARSRMIAHVEPGERDGECSVTVRGSRSQKHGRAMTVRCWPVSLPISSAKTCALGSRDLVRFDELTLPHLTSFFGFEIEVRLDGRSRRARFVLNLPLRGAPEDRRERVLQALLKDRAQVLRLLWILLAPDELTIRKIETLGALSAGSRGGGTGIGVFPLLESLLKALDRDPRRLDDVARLIDDLSRTPEGRELLPPGLEAIWGPVCAVRQEGAP